MLVNRALERLRRRQVRSLRDRSSRARMRRPLIVVPSILGTRILDGSDVLWGTLPRLFFGGAVAGVARARVGGVLDGFTVVPGVYAYDVYGGLLRFFERVGGYRRGHDLFVLEYDWRESLREGAAQLAERFGDVQARHGGEVDLLAVSSGGLVVRHFLAAAPSRVGRVVYVGTPQRGSFHAISVLHEGIQMVPLGRRFPASELAACKTCWDALPHPDDAVFLDERGTPRSDSLYDPGVWRALRLGPPGAELERNLARALALHRALDVAPVHADSVVIAARHLPTLSKVVVRASRAEIPACSPRRGDPLARHLFEPGDSGVAARSVEGLPGLEPSRIRLVTPKDHHRIPAEPAVHRLALEAFVDRGA